MCSTFVMGAETSYSVGSSMCAVLDTKDFSFDLEALFPSAACFFSVLESG